MQLIRYQTQERIITVTLPEDDDTFHVVESSIVDGLQGRDVQTVKAERYLTLADAMYAALQAIVSPIELASGRVRNGRPERVRFTVRRVVVRPARRGRR